jgi:hypothetical protein
LKGIAVELGIPVVVVVTKIDIAPKQILIETMQKVKAVLKMAQKMPCVVRSDEDAQRAAEAVSNADRSAPIFKISSVTGAGLQNLLTFLRVVPRNPNRIFTPNVPPPSGLKMDEPPAPPGMKQVLSSSGMLQEVPPGAINSSDTEVSAVAASGVDGLSMSLPLVHVPIDAVYQVPGVGFVVSGTVLGSELRTGMQLLMGPDRAGSWIPVLVRHAEVEKAFCSQDTEQDNTQRSSGKRAFAF